MKEQSSNPPVALSWEYIWNIYDGSSRELVNILNEALMDKMIPIGSSFQPPKWKQMADCVQEVFNNWRNYDNREKEVEEIASEKKDKDFLLSWLCFILLGSPAGKGCHEKYHTRKKLRSIKSEVIKTTTP